MGEYDNTIKIIESCDSEKYETINNGNRTFSFNKITKLICEYINFLDIGMLCTVKNESIYNNTYILNLFSQYMCENWNFVMVKLKDRTNNSIGLIPSFVENSYKNGVTDIIAENALHFQYVDFIIGKHLSYLENNYIGYKINYDNNNVDFIAKMDIPPSSYVESLTNIPFRLSQFPNIYANNNLVLEDGKLYSKTFIKAGSILTAGAPDIIAVIENNTITDEENNEFVQSAILEPVDEEDVCVGLNKKHNAEICSILDRYSYDNIYCSSDWHLYVKDDDTGEIKYNNEATKYLFNQMQTVTSNHIFIYLGDLTDDEVIGSDKLDDIQKELRNLKGICKILVLGNNDLLSYDYYLKCGFDYVVKRIEYKDFLFTHHPENVSENIINIHGHIHGYKDYKNCNFTNHIDVFPTLYNNGPVNISTLLKKLKAYEQEVKVTLNICSDEPISESINVSYYEEQLIINKEYARGDEFSSNHTDKNWYKFHLTAPIDNGIDQWYYVDSARRTDVENVPQGYISEPKKQLNDEMNTTYYHERISASRDFKDYFSNTEFERHRENLLINFHKDEYDSIKNRLNTGQIVSTTIVSKNVGTYTSGLKCRTPWGQTVVINEVTNFTRLIDHPNYNKLTPKQRLNIHKYSEKNNKPYEVISFQLIEGVGEPTQVSDTFEYNYNFSFISKDNTVPVYVVLTDTKTIIGKIIKKYASIPYNHASISFDDTLQKMYSFSQIGFVTENIKTTYKNINARYSVYVVFINRNIVDNVIKQLKDIENNIKQFKYNTMGLFGFILNKPIKSDAGYFCSEFVAVILKYLGIEGTKDTSLTTPYDFVQYKKHLCHVQKGYIKNFNPCKLLEQTKKIYDNIYKKDLSEASIFNMKVEEDAFIISVKTTESFMEEYDKAHRLLMEYDKSGNTEAMKHELAKLFYIITIIDTRYIHGSGLVKKILPNKVEYAKKARAFAMNDFKKYFQIVLKQDPNFDFTEYYKNTSYGDDSIKIDKNVIGLIKKILF